MFNQELFKKSLTTSWLGHCFQYFDELESSNSYAKELKQTESLHGTVVLVDHQTKGRGQYERKWKTQPGANLTFTLIFEPKKNERLSLLTLACALAITEAINIQQQLETQIKWPNDILHKEKKLCGILTETQFAGNKLEKIIVGIGLNVNQQKFETEIKSSATSLSLVCNETCNREKLLAEILHQIEKNYTLWNQHKADLVKRINRSMIGFGKWVRLTVEGEQLKNQYKFLGVSNSGELLVLDKNMDVQTFAYEQVRVLV